MTKHWFQLSLRHPRAGGDPLGLIVSKVNMDSRLRGNDGEMGAKFNPFIKLGNISTDPARTLILNTFAKVLANE